MSQVEGVVELGTHGRVGKHKHHQEQSQDDPGNNDSGERDLCAVSDDSVCCR